MKIIKAGRKPKQKVLRVNCKYCTSKLEINRHDAYLPKLRTRLGVFSFPFYVYKCQHCGKENIMHNNQYCKLI